MPRNNEYRKIIHMDLDAFFCAVEELRDPTLKDKPFAVGGAVNHRGVIASCSYAARRYGIHSAMATARALRLCPQLILVSGKHSDYQQKSREVMEILESYTALLEKVSIDEAFMDVSDLPETGEVIARAIQKNIREKTNLSASFGIAANKLMAKIANDFGKKQHKGVSYPGAIQEVAPGEEADFLENLPVKMLWGVGESTEKRLAQLGIKKIGDLAKYSHEDLSKIFGKYGYILYQHARGIDQSDLIMEHEVKSVSQEITFAKDISDEKILRAVFLEMSEKIGRRLRAQNLAAQTLKIKFRYPDFSTYTRQVTIISPTAHDLVIFEAAWELLKIHWDRKKPLRLVGVGASKLTENFRQLSLWETRDEKQERLLEAMDNLEKKYGKKIIARGSKLISSQSEDSF